MNLVFLLLIVAAFSTSAWQQLTGPRSEEMPLDLLTNALFKSSEDAVALSIGLIGVMAFFLGLMKVAESAGLLDTLARMLEPVMRRLFPDVPKNHPAHGAMVMNVSANMLGLGNAATPFGIKAMQALETLNKNPGVATNAMVLFLAINTSSVTLIPTKVIALRAAAGSMDPAGIIMTTLFATLISTVVAITAAIGFQRFYKLPATDVLPSEGTDSDPETHNQGSLLLSFIGFSFFSTLIALTFMYGQQFSAWIIPSLTVGILLLGYYRKVPIYEVFTEGAKEGFWTAVKIMPYLVAILVAIGMLKASGALGALIGFLSPLTSKIGIPAEALPMVFMRPLSGSGSLGVLSSILDDPTIGPDGYIGYLTSTMMGSTETTFYILAVYFGAVQIKKIRHALWVGLLADAAGMLASVWIVRRLFGI